MKPETIFFRMFYFFLCKFNLVFSSFLFLIGSQFITFFSFPLPLPVKIRKRFRENLLMWFARFINSINLNIHFYKKNIYQENFKKPAMIISNHVSVIDTPLILSLTSKLVIITNDWIIRSKFTWLLKKYSNFCMIDDNIELSMNYLKEKIQDGYSILIFPEGATSPYKIKRFHKGAFLMAEQLKLDILPLLIVASGEFLGKESFFKYPGKIHLTLLQRITPENESFGQGFSNRTKEICAFYRDEYKKLSSKPL